MPRRRRPDIGRRSRSNVQRASSRANRTDDQRESDREKSRIAMAKLRSLRRDYEVLKAESEESYNEEAVNQETTQIEKSSRKRTIKIAVGSLLLEEKLLIKAQRTFYEEENLRAQEKHVEEMETLSAERELLYLEIAEMKRKLNDLSQGL